MALSTTLWNSAEYLKTDEDIRLYLEACMEEAEDDPAFIVQALGVVARARNMSQIAKESAWTPTDATAHRFRGSVEGDAGDPAGTPRRK